MRPRASPAVSLPLTQSPEDAIRRGTLPLIGCEPRHDNY